MKSKFKKDTKVYKMRKYLLHKLTLGSQPQLLNAPQMRRDSKIDPSGYPDFYSNTITYLRNAGMIKEVGNIRSSPHYIWTDIALNYIKTDPDVIHYWINYGKKWFLKYDKANFVCCGGGCEKHENAKIEEPVEDDPFEAH